MNDRRSIGRTRISKGALLSIVTAGCWTILLAIVLSSVFAARNVTKQIGSKGRHSTQGR